MVKAYRDTWELGLHSYLTYLRDRLLLARDLLTDSGSIFLQISDENLHHVREVMDEVFGAENFAGIFSFYKISSQSTDKIPSIVDYILCYARDKQRQKLRLLQRMKAPGERGAKQYTLLISTADMKDVVRMTEEQLSGVSPIPEGWKVCALGPLTSQGFQEGRSGPYGFEGKTYLPPPNRHWSYAPGPGGEMDRLAAMGRIKVSGDSIRSVLLADDNPLTTLDNVWLDTGSGSFTEQWLYVVQTNAKVIQRCMLMTTDPGDLVLDPTCGSGTTAYVAEQWGRRWITIDISRVPVALARQRLLTATYAYYDLKDPDSGPAGGFVYKRRQNRRGEEAGGIVPHITLKSIANNEPPEEEVLVDRPEVVNNITRVTGPFCVEATIPTPVDWEGDGMEDSGIRAVAEHGSYLDRMLEVLRKSPVLQLGGGRTVAFKNIRPPAKTLSLSAEAIYANCEDKTVAMVFGPENGAVSEKTVYEAAREAYAKGYTQLYVFGFAIQPNARKLIDQCEAIGGIPATYVQATPDLLMADLLKNMRSSQIFSVCGLPEVRIKKIPRKNGDSEHYSVELLGLDVFDPVTMETVQCRGGDVPAWFLDADHNGLCFHVCHAFFPRTSAWNALKRALRGDFEDSVWQHLAGTVSAPFEAGRHGQIAVKVIDDRGNELLVVKALKEAM